MLRNVSTYTAAKSSSRPVLAASTATSHSEVAKAIGASSVRRAKTVTPGAADTVPLSDRIRRPLGPQDPRTARPQRENIRHRTRGGPVAAPGTPLKKVKPSY